MSYSCARIINYTSSNLVKIIHLIQLFFHMLTLQALTELNVTDRYGSDLNVSINQLYPYAIYICPAGECTTMLDQPKNYSSLQGIKVSLKSINDLQLST